jgi:glycosyltransferase involved in cell wall biosynthesis
MKIAIIGTRGIPARYGGFETFAEELSTRLVAKGLDVTVFSRRKFFKKSAIADFKGVIRRASPTIAHKYLETPLSALTAFMSLKRSNTDLVLLCNAANSPFSWVLKLKGIKLVTNVDGIERYRSKWNALGKLWYLLGEYTSVCFSDVVIADAQVIAQYYKEKYKVNPVVITYGALPNFKSDSDVFKNFNIPKGEYILYVSRLEPENNALGVVQAYLQAETKIPLVVVGDAPYAQEYKNALYTLSEKGNREKAPKRVILTGFQFGSAYQALQANCKVYIQATEVGGTHPALIEAMSYGNVIIANGTPENIEVLADAGLYYDKNNFTQLAKIIDSVVSDKNDSDQTNFENNFTEQLRERAKERAQNTYSWSNIANQYENLFNKVVKS